MPFRRASDRASRRHLQAQRHFEVLAEVRVSALASLGLHHEVSTAIDYDMIIAAWWTIV
jgi:hypothetical protein